MRNLFLKSVFSTRKKLAALIALAVLLLSCGSDGDDVTLEHLQDIGGNIYPARLHKWSGLDGRESDGNKVELIIQHLLKKISHHKLLSL